MNLSKITESISSLLDKGAEYDDILEALNVATEKQKAAEKAAKQAEKLAKKRRLSEKRMGVMRALKDWYVELYGVTPSTDDFDFSIFEELENAYFEGKEPTVKQEKEDQGVTKKVKQIKKNKPNSLTSYFLDGEEVDEKTYQKGKDKSNSRMKESISYYVNGKEVDEKTYRKEREKFSDPFADFSLF